MWPVPRMLDLEAHHYPKRWLRSLVILQGSLLLIGFQISRLGLMSKQATIATGEYMDWGDHDAP
jgi:hypothetical protein